MNNIRPYELKEGQVSIITHWVNQPDYVGNKFEILNGVMTMTNKNNISTIHFDTRHLRFCTVNLISTGKYWNKKEWRSFCSVHAVYNKNCKACNTGMWTNIWMSNISKLFYKIAPKLWIWFANRKNPNK